DVDPIRSAKTIVTTLRATASSAAPATREAPQASQNWASGLRSAPHAGQRSASDLPQPPQNRAPAPCALPQLLQFMTTPGRRRACYCTVAACRKVSAAGRLARGAGLTPCRDESA